MLPEFVTALRMLVLFTVLTGLIYPGVVTVLTQTFYREKANGSIIRRNDQVVGSELIGQNFRRPEYFHPRPSAAGDAGYDAQISGGSNLGPTSKRLANRIRASAESFKKENPDFREPIPSDLLTSSGSGLDPHLSPGSALAQVNRIARARCITPDEVLSIVLSHTEHPDLGLLGEARVNVLLLNLALDEKYPLRK